MAVALAMQGCVWARELQAPNLVVWSAFDGYGVLLLAVLPCHVVTATSLAHIAALSDTSALPLR